MYTFEILCIFALFHPGNRRREIESERYVLGDLYLLRSSVANCRHQGALSKMADWDLISKVKRNWDTLLMIWLINLLYLYS